MTVRIIKEPDVHLTQDQYNRLMDEYRRAYMFYAGTPPSFESFARQRANAPAPCAEAAATGGVVIG